MDADRSVWWLGVVLTWAPIVLAGAHREVPHWILRRDSASVLSLVHTCQKKHSTPTSKRPPPQEQLSNWMSAIDSLMPPKQAHDYLRRIKSTPRSKRT